MAGSRSLRKVRETRHFDLQTVAKYAGISADRLEEFETGVREPSPRQLERLAVTYGLASYLLGSDTIPNLPDTVADFRRSTPRPAHLSPAGMARIWSAEEVSAVAAQLSKAVKLDSPNWLKDLPSGKLTPKNALSLRSFFDDWFASRRDKFDLSGTDEQKFLAGFRLFIEAQGSIVRINDAPPEDFLGFFLNPEGSLPTIFVNRKISAPKAQLFTILHEYGHWSLDASGISNPFVVRNEIERSCNQFAAEFLAPAEAFSELAGKQSRADRNDVFRFIAAVSRQSLLSMHATAIRLVETGHLAQGQLKSWEAQRRTFTPKELKNEERDLDAETQSGGAVHAKQVGEVGYLPSYLAKLSFENKFIDRTDVQAGIGLAASLQEKAFSLAARRFEAAVG
jgi:Zn-dependent peptidase ImmA (M78 family)/transcriptional regulator with XRE-family HTH domain